MRVEQKELISSVYRLCALVIAAWVVVAPWEIYIIEYVYGFALGYWNGFGGNLNLNWGN
jgi:hypothetical protein